MNISVNGHAYVIAATYLYVWALLVLVEFSLVAWYAIHRARRNHRKVEDTPWPSQPKHVRIIREDENG